MFDQLADLWICKRGDVLEVGLFQQDLTFRFNHPAITDHDHLVDVKALCKLIDLSPNGLWIRGIAVKYLNTQGFAIVGSQQANNDLLFAFLPIAIIAEGFLLPEAGAFYIMDRGYVDFEWLFTLHTASAFFVIRAESNTQYQRRYSRPVDKSTGMKCDQTIVLTGVNTATDYPQPLCRIKYHDENTGKTFNFLTNNFAIPAQTVADLYRCR